MSDVGSLGEQTFRTAETKSRFTNYSMSSSVIRRNAGLTLLDDRFEHVSEVIVIVRCIREMKDIECYPVLWKKYVYVVRVIIVVFT